jgi:hypothetical protein
VLENSYGVANTTFGSAVEELLELQLATRATLIRQARNRPMTDIIADIQKASQVDADFLHAGIIEEHSFSRLSFASQHAIGTVPVEHAHLPTITKPERAMQVSFKKIGQKDDDYCRVV